MVKDQIIVQKCSLIFNFFAVAFSIYDVDKDGYISNDDLYQILKLMVGQNKNIKDAQLQQIVDRTFMTACSDKNGKLSFEDFCKVNSSYTLLFFFLMFDCMSLNEFRQLNHECQVVCHPVL